MSAWQTRTNLIALQRHSSWPSGETRLSRPEVGAQVAVPLFNYNHSTHFLHYRKFQAKHLHCLFVSHLFKIFWHLKSNLGCSRTFINFRITKVSKEITQICVKNNRNSQLPFHRFSDVQGVCGPFVSFLTIIHVLLCRNVFVCFS